MLKYGIPDITIEDYSQIAMVDLLDDVLMFFSESHAIEGMPVEYVQAALDLLVNTRNGFAEKGGIVSKELKPYTYKPMA